MAYRVNYRIAAAGLPLWSWLVTVAVIVIAGVLLFTYAAESPIRNAKEMKAPPPAGATIQPIELPPITGQGSAR